MADHPTEAPSVLRARFERGLASAMDPFNNTAFNGGGTAVTTPRSFWLHRTCEICAHTFRVGDEVHVGEDGRVQHSSGLLPCARGDRGAAAPFKESADFFAGLYEAWPPPKNLPIIRLDAASPLVAAPYAGFRRHACAVCGHTLRVNDHVIICPCSLDEPLCQTAIHSDRVNGLPCLESWNPGINQQGNEQRYCPITLRRLDDPDTR